MPVTVVVGGQYGSEGKGKVAHHVARVESAAAAVRVGGPNSGHSAVGPDGRIVVLRALPTAALLPDVLCVLGPGSYVDVDVLLDEIALTGLPPERVIVDHNAFLVTEDDRRAELAAKLPERIGSTGSGTGAAVWRRVARAGPATLARFDVRLAPYVGDAVACLHDLCRSNARVIVEGTQGFGLSVLHSEHWPHVTSRDVSAAAAVAEAGLSPLDVDEVVLVLRAFPIRVAGASGPMGAEELTWDQVAREAGLPSGLVERTSVTARIRRVSRFDSAVVRKALAANNPSIVVLNHLDYVDGAAAATGEATERIIAFVGDVEGRIGRRVDLLGFSPVGLTSRSPVSAGP
jgi:adenylosuccinate synthase